MIGGTTEQRTSNASTGLKYVFSDFISLLVYLHLFLDITGS